MGRPSCPLFPYRVTRIAAGLQQGCISYEARKASPNPFELVRCEYILGGLNIKLEPPLGDVIRISMGAQEKTHLEQHRLGVDNS